ncbi:zinc-binding alcohol dehydrogenase family protein [Dinghuibacter silviterrae]|uniref:Threonine dehydrogenase-like Zn-dependent dehydrogenase n=1 Tax=Dinghuibacter silviterrae TaxID=1539049 RepID=A0A4R8DJW5_9BACT|nr:zinc-binding alcohol dehydrogenase family protein [Dinghuibacter silviterrae]TDW97614.1 threonine dehydrogenase-like Zn-dependent dehydrogenase [Dinghuibacter silviterrae]
MRAWSCTTPGSFSLLDIPAPEPQDGRTTLRIRRIGVCGTDLHAFQGTQPYFSYPRILGHELAGDPVDGPERGDACTLIPYYACGHCIACRRGLPNCCTSIKVCGVHIDGGMVEYLSVPNDALVPGEGLSHDALALVEPLAIGAHGVRRAGITPGEFVLVIGAGPIGLGTMAFARIAGARVIALDVNEARLRFCREQLGVEHTVLAGGAGATAAGPTPTASSGATGPGGAAQDGSAAPTALEAVRDITSGDMATVVIDATGNLKAINGGLDYLAHGGRYVLIGLQKEAFCFSHPEFHKRESTLMSSRNATREDFRQVMRALRSGEVDPVTFITHRAPFDKVGAEFPGWLDPASGVIKAMIEL